MAMGSKAFESPLISHARMRAMYRALVEIRGLAQQRKDRSYRGVEACWVGTAIDLKDGDLTSDAGGSNDDAMLEYARAVGRRPAGGAVKANEVRRMLKRLAGVKAGAFPGSAAERLLCAVGEAMALKAAGGHGVAVAYVGHGEITAFEWRRALAVMGQVGLPLVVVALPGGVGDLDAIAHKAAARPDLAVPVIPVDAGDVVAIYRVAQETIVRARAGGGAAVIEGVACGTDAVKLMGAQLVRKRICTEAWVQGVETHLSKLITTR
jgi:hypothetical protein